MRSSMHLDGELLRALIHELERVPVGGSLEYCELTSYSAELVAIHMHWLRNAGLATAPNNIGRPQRLTGLTAIADGLRRAAADESRWRALITRLRRYPDHQMATALYIHTRG